MTSERDNRKEYRGLHVGRNRNIYGAKVKRPREEYPYSFDHYCVYKTIDFDQTTHTIYSDRMRQWDSEKFDTCHEHVFGNSGQYFDCRNPELIEQFLKEYFDWELSLTGIEEGCNFSNGYPYWVFYIIRAENAEPKPEDNSEE